MSKHCPLFRWCAHRCYIGRFRVPCWLFAAAPDWVHRHADRLGGVQ